MMPCVRAAPPPLLAEHAAALTDEYVARRATNPAHRLRWPTIARQSLLGVVRDALAQMTAYHCAYCDKHPLDERGEEQVDAGRSR